MLPLKIFASTPTDEIILEPPLGWFSLRLADLWTYRELLYFLIWRDLKVRYKQTILGAGWAILQPVLSMIVFSVIFGKLGRLPSDGIPYPVFSYAALLPWQLFSRALGDASSSLITNQNMVTKIYFPRLFLPASSVLSGLVDFGISFLVLIGLMFFYHIRFSWHMLILPAFIMMALLSAMAVGLWLSALNVQYRDIKYVTPFLIQIWLYATPIAYSSSLIPKAWRPFYGLNPMTGVADGFRWALLGQAHQIDSMFYISLVIIIVLFISGLIYFQHMEQTFADLV